MIKISRTRSDSVNIAIKKIMSKINNYELVSGDVISDLDLSKQFDMSRTPVREAVFQLINDGILERTSTRVIVKPLTLSDIIEILQIRESIESYCIRIITERGGLTEDELDKLLVIHNTMCNDVSHGDFNQNFANDTLFHESIVMFAGNQRMLHVSRQVDWQAQRLRFLTLFTQDRYKNTILEHSNIIEAFKKNDTTLLNNSLSEHYKQTVLNYKAILENEQWSKVLVEIIKMTKDK